MNVGTVAARCVDGKKGKTGGRCGRRAPFQRQDRVSEEFSGTPQLLMVIGGARWRAFVPVIVGALALFGQNRIGGAGQGTCISNQVQNRYDWLMYLNQAQRSPKTANHRSRNSGHHFRRDGESMSANVNLVRPGEDWKHLTNGNCSL